MRTIFEMSTSIPATDELITDLNLEQTEVYNVLVQLDPSKSCGLDNIPVRLLKECAPNITPSLTSLFNKSLQNAILHSEWKLCIKMERRPLWRITEQFL